MLIRNACLCLAGSLLALGALAASVNPYADHNGKLPPAVRPVFGDDIDHCCGR